ncbi:Flagellar protein FliO [Vibrio aerogenes CECT 7868]|uniref:Flagellar protein n=1 Tax=Vibrio aerogenes CECT 7868 TaxID=1216006 RepID=A0A1M5W5J8_9VIBR|nr:flagellar biosynthetic protein FliO [Vibrio aerogenes]SHH82802.1 Flagellar protein FliO [Vibrio aerogenes CECT 7868]
MKHYLTGLLFFSFPALAAAPGSQIDILTTLGSLIFVVVFILILAVLLKRMRLPALGHQKGLSVIRQLPVGTKERLLIVQAGEEQFLVGVTSQSIQLISRLETPLEVDSPVGSQNSFASQLARLMKK